MQRHYKNLRELDIDEKLRIEQEYIFLDEHDDLQE